MKKEVVSLLGMMWALALNAGASELDSHPTSVVVAQDGSGKFTHVQEAIDAAPSEGIAPYIIYIRNGSYREMVHVPANKPFIHLIGEDAQHTVIHHCLNVGGKPNNETKDSTYWTYSVHNPQSEVFGTQNSVVLVEGSDFYAENIMFQNDWGVDFFGGPQALAMNTQADRVAFYHCIFRSHQDTWMTTGKDDYRHYINECRIEGAVDYLYGSGDVLVENTTFYCTRAGSVIVAPGHGRDSKYGYVMNHCQVDGGTAAADVSRWGVKLGRPWKNAPRAIWMNTIFRIPINQEGWSDMGTIPAIFAEYNSQDVNGVVQDLAKRKATYKHGRETVVTGSCRAMIGKDEAEKLTYEAIIGGKDGWNPRIYMHSSSGKAESEK